MQRFSMPILLIVGAFAFAWQSTAFAKRYDVQCWAEGHKLRQTSTDSKNNFVSARLSLDINAKDGGVDAELKEWVGHLAIARDATALTKVDYHGVFSGKEKASSLSPRARVYKDGDYFRYRDFDASQTTRQDGGGMNGELVVSKKFQTAGEDATYDAHYVFQAGDHMGGTVDYTCVNYN